MLLIENTEDLSQLCNRLSKNDFVCVDLEFLREHTYFAKPCLIQIASIAEAAAIDPLAENIDLNPFFELMTNNEVTKVFHSGRQDIEIIYNLSHKIPSPLFDTQIAAQALGFGESISYENLVHHILNIELDKSSRLSDWSKRPLSEAQLNYALSDVTHLVNIYQSIITSLTKENRLDWISDELKNLADEANYKIEPYNIWQKMRHRSHSPLFLTTLRELAAWRELRAINKDVPRQSFIKDDVLINICAAHPACKEELATVRGMRHDIAIGKIGDEIIDVMQNIKELPKDLYVTVPKIKDSFSGDGPLLELLKMLLKIVAQEQRIVPRLIASEDDLKSFCIDSNTPTPFMSGWRYEIFGRPAQDILKGETAISYDAKHHKIKFFKISKNI